MRVTKQERVETFALRMKAVAKGGDCEANHGEADDLMADELTKLGYKKGIAIFEKMDKWYA